MSLALAVGVHLLLLLLLLRLAPSVEKKPPPGGPTVVFTVPAPSPAPQASRQASRQKQQAQRTASASRPVPTPPPTKPTPNSIARPWVINPDLAGFSLQAGSSRQQVAAATDAPGDSAAEAGQSGSGGKSVGRGKNGQLLYAAQWFREPTEAEMSPYMPKGSFVGGTADIACRTVERYHVEDCEELGQNPPGSGLSRALREAAWQFLVRPPRLNGRPMVGEWVRIHFDFIERKAPS